MSRAGWTWSQRHPGDAGHSMLSFKDGRFGIQKSQRGKGIPG